MEKLTFALNERMKKRALYGNGVTRIFLAQLVRYESETSQMVTA